MHIQFHTPLQCIQISTRINTTSVHTYIFSLFYIACIRMFILIDPIFNTMNIILIHMWNITFCPFVSYNLGDSTSIGDF